MAGIGEEGRRSSSGTERNWGGLEAEGRRCLGEKEEEEQAVATVVVVEGEVTGYPRSSLMH